jgi:hypothetical protein
VDLLVPAPARRQHEHRHRQPGVAPAPQDRQAVDFRQAQVEDDRVVALRLREEIPARAVAGAVHGIAGLAQRRRQLLRNPRFVFDDQDPHRTSVITHTALNGS